MRFILPGLLACSFALFALPVADSSKGARCFPDGFLFGSATAAYQVEGAWNEGGRTPSICDDFCHANSDVACANVADDFYHRYKSDIQLMVETGLKSFRFSISWSRAMNWDPETKQMKANPQGIAFYHDLIGELNKNGITPIMTIYHWDLPSELHTELSPPGWLNAEIIDHFVQFSELMYQEFGSKVQYWTTFNEPWAFVGMGYGTGRLAPGFRGSETQAYVAAHNVLLSHGKAVQRFRELKDSNSAVIHPSARIGIVLPIQYTYPLNPSDSRDVAAAERQLQFTAGWFLNPVVNGEYPAVMRERVGDRLPSFTSEEAAMLKGSYDLFMLNHYSSNLVTDCDSNTSSIKCGSLSAGWERDMGLDGWMSTDPTRMPTGALWAGADNDKCGTFNGYPQGYMDAIKWMHAFDTKADILLTENGWCGTEEIDNPKQLWYYQTYMEQVYKAIVEENISVIGHTVWSFVDNYEWGSFKPRFGMFFVNWTAETGTKNEVTPKDTDLARIPRIGTKWYAQLAKTNCLDFDSSDLVDLAEASENTVASWSSGAMIYWVVGIAGVIFAVTRHRRKQMVSSVQERGPLLVTE